MGQHFKNATDVEAIRPPVDKPVLETWHATEKGFGVRVGRRKKNGEFSKVYLARYRDEDKKDVKEVLGRVADIAYRDAFKLAQEKCDRARELAADIKAGRPRAATIKDCYEQYFKARSKEWATDTIKGYEKQLRNLTPLHNKKMDELTNEDWLNHYLKVSANQGRSTALGMMRLGSALYSFRIMLEKLTKNPCGALLKTSLIVKDKRRSTRIPRKELPGFWTALHARAGGPQRDFILWVLFTGFRKSLAGNLQWSRINFEERTYRIDENDVCNKAKTEFHYPIPDYLWKTVIVPRLALRKPEDVYIIESPKKTGRPLHDVKGTFKALAGVTGVQMSLHPLRRTFSSCAHAATGDLLLTKRLMTRSSGPTNRDHAATEMYIQYDAEQVREAVELAAAAILNLVKPSHAAIPEPAVEEVEDLAPELEAV
jgi:integrase